MKIYHNPRCSKSRQTLALLEENDQTVEIVEYLKTPPNEQELREILSMLGIQPRELMRTHEAEYKDNNLGDPALTDDQLIAAMIAYPKVIERPIVVTGSTAVIGRPPEKVLEVISNG
ncbi:MAG: arsenate reductase (glutaredoxin) [bacterium]